ncbi:hypothetical protein J2X11_000684 [Aeromicrobium panaciterrae]|uniref:Lycopene cyclase domain-containing protein n=1 Tax=Aeromicrobium panaciterrae TaxID=363861 RepID=A0ABU1UL12_9ACTN|nr:hypothetical protein [Aeromicrobium panaciterrae]MDR7085845.1 hypothetical protein [Aeromicrobium panaciterrae]
MKRFALVAGVSAIFLTLCDQLFHVRTDTLVYHWDPQVLGQTIIVPLTFLLATVSMLDTSLRVNGVAPRSTSSNGVMASLAIVTSVYLISGFVDQKYSVAYALALLATWAIRVVRRGEPAIVLGSAILIAVGGVLGEAALSAVGEFSYLQPDVIGVPWWLFPLYLHGALAARDVASTVVLRHETSPVLHQPLP